MIFEYSATAVFTKSIDIEDIGNMAISCTNHEGASWYLLTKTVLGKTSILTFGPIAIDLPILLDGFKVEYEKIDYKESKINSKVDRFINDGKKLVEIVEETDEYSVFELFPNIVELFKDV